MLSPFEKTWKGIGFRHIPVKADGMKLDPLNFKYCYGNHRWSAAKQWTFYLAEGVDILTVEWRRHQAESRSPKLAMNANKREVFEIRVAKILTIDLRDANVLKTLGGKGAPNCFLDKGKARKEADFIRLHSDAQAIFVPVIGFLDHIDKWNLVIFLEKLGSDPTKFFKAKSLGFLQAPVIRGFIDGGCYF